MRKNKLIKGLIAAFLATTMLVGCSSGGSAPKEQPESSGTQKELVNLTWYTVADQSPKDLEMVTEAINEYTAEKIGVTVDLNFISFGDYNEKMQAIINSGGNYDIAFTANWTNSFTQNAKRGSFYDITELVKTEGKEMYELIDPLFWGKASIDGSIYAVPGNKELDPAIGLILPTKYTEKYDFDTSTVNSIDDMEPYFKAIKDNEEGISPWYITNSFSLNGQHNHLIDFTIPVGIDETSATAGDLKIVNSFETESMMNFLKTMHRYYQEGYINADAPTLPMLDTTGLKGKDAGAFWVGSGPASEKAFSEAIGQEVELVQLFNPIVKNELGSAQAISSQSKHPAEAVRFLNLVNTDPYLRNLLNYGLEGTHYERVEDNIIKLLPESQGWNVAHYTMGNMFITDLLEGEPTDKWEQYKEFNENVIVSPAFGFIPETDSLRNEIAAVTNIFNEFDSSISTGSVDPEVYVPRLNEKLKEAGIDKIIDELQMQIDEWKANK